jgi:hypothetical protein
MADWVQARVAAVRENARKAGAARWAKKPHD